MRHNKMFSATIMLFMIAFFAMGPAPVYSAPRPTPATITATFDFSTFPDVAGTFTIRSVNLPLPRLREGGRS